MKREEILEIGYCVPDAIIPDIWKQEEQVAEWETKLNQTRKNGKEPPPKYSTSADGHFGNTRVRR